MKKLIKNKFLIESSFSDRIVNEINDIKTKNGNELHLDTEPTDGY